MSELQQPKPDDVVKGGHNPTPLSSVVLGGIEGIKQRLASNSDEVRIAALFEALNYGQEGQEQVLQIVQTETGPVQWVAYDLLWVEANERERQKLLKYFPLRSSVGADYTKLRDLLADGKWKEADVETGKKMLEVAGRENEGRLLDEDIDRFPSVDLHTINLLWVEYSKGRFGFSIQKRIYESLGGTRNYDYKIWRKFWQRVGWSCDTKLTFSLNAPLGHLPTIFGIDYWCLLSRPEL